MRGYFGIGVEGLSKPMNLGSVMRSAHAFGASFVFTIGSSYAETDGAKSDTSRAPAHVPFYEFENLEAMRLPRDCSLVGVELIEGAVELPSFRHPQCAAYVLGAERGDLSPPLIARCSHMVRIPTEFCVNVGVAAAIVMYDRIMTLGRYPPRPVRPGGPVEGLPAHVFGPPRFRRSGTVEASKE